MEKRKSPNWRGLAGGGKRSTRIFWTDFEIRCGVDGMKTNAPRILFALLATLGSAHALEMRDRFYFNEIGNPDGPFATLEWHYDLGYQLQPILSPNWEFRMLTDAHHDFIRITPDAFSYTVSLGGVPTFGIIDVSIPWIDWRFTGDGANNFLLSRIGNPSETYQMGFTRIHRTPDVGSTGIMLFGGLVGMGLLRLKRKAA